MLKPLDLTRLLNATNVKPNEIGYIEMRGTGAQAGNMMETMSLLDVFLPAQSKRKSSL